MLTKVSFYETISSNTDGGEGEEEKNLYSVRLQSDPDSTSNIQSSFTKGEGMHTLNQNILQLLGLPEYFRTQNAQDSNDNSLTVFKLSNC